MESNQPPAIIGNGYEIALPQQTVSQTSQQLAIPRLLPQIQDGGHRQDSNRGTVKPVNRNVFQQSELSFHQRNEQPSGVEATKLDNNGVESKTARKVMSGKNNIPEKGEFLDNSSEESDTEQAKEPVNKSKSLKFLIKRVVSLEKKVTILKDEKAPKLKQERLEVKPETKKMKVMGLKSNVVNIQLDCPKEDFADELKKLREKVQQLQNKSIVFSGSRAVVAVSERPPHLLEGEEISQNHSRFKQMYESADRKSSKMLGRIVKKSELQSASPEKVHRDSPILDFKPLYKNDRDRMDLSPNNLGNNILESNELSPFNSKDESIGFVRSRPDFSKGKRETKQFQSSTRMLQFNMEHEKLVVESQNTEENQKSAVRNQEKLSFQQALKLLPRVPILPSLPQPQASEEEVIEVGKHLFELFNVEKIKDDRTVLKVRRYKNCIYFGVDSDQNILWHNDGKMYFGGWRVYNNGEEQKSGHCIEFQNERFVYKGQFANGKRNGEGVLLTIKPKSSSSIYMGQFQDGMKHGKGKQVQEGGASYDGQWQRGKKEGFGRLKLTDNDEYEGIFLFGLKHGYGIESFKNGDFYKGEYREGKFEGKGFYQWENGSSYDGDFRGGMRDGFGFWRMQQNGGDTYEGGYQSDLKHGPGIYKWANGSVFSGEFREDKKHGKGSVKYPNGKSVKLEWQHGNVIRKLDPNEIIETGTLARGQRTNPKRISSSYAQKQVQNKEQTKLANFKIGKHFDRQPSQASRNVQEQPPRGSLRRIERPPSQKLPSTFQRDSRSLSDVSKPKFELKRGNAPKDPPYRGMRSSTNIVTF